MASFGSLRRLGSAPPSSSGSQSTSAELRAEDIFASYPSAIAALCAQTVEGPVGFVVTSFAAGISFDPPMAVFSAQSSSRTWQTLRRAPILGVSVLGHDQQQTCHQLASRTRDRFETLNYSVTGAGAVLLADSPLHLECEVISETPAGDHHVVLLKVLGAQVDSAASPLVYRSRGFHHLVAAG
ncbi:flavin reductase family protein [Nesterenkonia lutea]|uniref:Flavin reductase (DIM6/NTAB) family NADH-FMN oxidoreductase RutF n=1 Tax=Nesterenkonia lutea TaxID=272919 RepID=A0ABR9JFE7_9MICC|nr:flavin reductase family protein [Nesterenkonia lutea]MBE1524656.1 flavin reductase (DIM6/NTAB) family NADH-FMN oxidoreductase RutF [Nesterenkonia lutea]